VLGERVAPRISPAHPVEFVLGCFGLDQFQWGAWSAQDVRLARPLTHEKA